MKTKTITTLEEAESIVKRNNRLSWDGWNIVYTKPDQYAYTKVSGAFVDGRWVNKQVVSPDRNGWEIPVDFIRS